MDKRRGLAGKGGRREQGGVWRVDELKVHGGLGGNVFLKSSTMYSESTSILKIRGCSTSGSHFRPPCSLALVCVSLSFFHSCVGIS